jgi:hypothetical protein
MNIRLSAVRPIKRSPRLRAGWDRIGHINPDRFHDTAMRAFEQLRFKAARSFDIPQEVTGSAAIALQMAGLNIVVTERFCTIRHLKILLGLQLDRGHRLIRTSMSWTCKLREFRRNTNQKAF